MHRLIHPSIKQLRELLGPYSLQLWLFNVDRCQSIFALKYEHTFTKDAKQMNYVQKIKEGINFINHMMHEKSLRQQEEKHIGNEMASEFLSFGIISNYIQQNEASN